MALPVAKEPVNEMASTSGAPTSAGPISAPAPRTTLKTPSGMPASSASSASRTADNGVSSAGLSSTELPAARMADTNAATALGPFQGVTKATTPRGALTSTTKDSTGVAGARPEILVGQPAK